MDFEFSPEDIQFKEEVIEFIKKELPSDWKGYDLFGMPDAEWEQAKVFIGKLAARKWLCLSWPEKYGGMAAPIIRQVLFNEVMEYYNAPGAFLPGVRLFGPTLIEYGTEEQKQRFLPGISLGKVMWAQGFSEFGAGSDLAALEMSAVQDGDHYILNGHKMWSSGANRSDWMFLLARTNPNVPKHRGISHFVVDLKSPGITIKPWNSILNEAMFDEVRFDNVSVPKENLVGGQDKGWHIAMATLNFERSGIHWWARAQRTIDEIVRYLRQQPGSVRHDPLIRHQLVELTTKSEIVRLLAYKIAWMQSKGMQPTVEPSAAKLVGSELTQRVAEVGISILGKTGLLTEEDSPLRGWISYMSLRAIPWTIAQGSSEIQRNIIATRGMDLPRS